MVLAPLLLLVTAAEGESLMVVLVVTVGVLSSKSIGVILVREIWFPFFLPLRVDFEEH